MIERKEIKKIGVLPAGKVIGVLYLALGLIIGIPIACLSLFGASILASAGLQDPDVAGASLLTGVGGLVGYGICLPLIYAVIGFIGGAIMALIYNIVAGVIGGIEFEIGDVGSKY
jgi:hypothetical protein